MQDYGYNEDRAQIKKMVIWIVVGVVIAVLLGWGIWALRVATSGVAGQGNAVVQKNSAANWTQAQAGFVVRYAEVEATDRKIQNAWERLQKDPEDRFAETNYYGARDVCESQVADYNSLARTYLAEDFRDADLPEQIDDTNPLTDCKEN